MSYLPCRRSGDSDYSGSTSTTPHNKNTFTTSGVKRSNGKRESIASSDTVSSLVDLALRSGCKDVLHQKCQQLIERITFLTDSIIETTSIALDDTTTESPEPQRRSQKHFDPMTSMSTTTTTTSASASVPRPFVREKSGSIRNSMKSNTNNNNNTNTNSNNSNSNNNSVQKMKSGGVSASAVVNSQNGIRSHSSSISRHAGDRPFVGMPAVFTVKEEPRVGGNVIHSHTKQNEKSKSSQREFNATRPSHNSVSRELMYESSSQLLYSTGTRDARPLFVEERELSEADVRKTLSLVSPTDRILYCELLHVQSREKNTAAISSVSNTHTNDDTARFLRCGSFTKAIYSHAPVDSYTTTTSDMNSATTPGKPSVQFKGDCGKSSVSPSSPSLLSVRSSNAKMSIVKTPPCRETRRETQSSNTNTRAKSLPMATTSVTKVHKKEKTNNNNNNNNSNSNSGISTPPPVVWNPTLPMHVSNSMRRKVSSNDRSRSQGKFNGEYNSDRTCNSREVNCSNSNLGYLDDDDDDDDYVDVDYDDGDENDTICIPKESYNPLSLNISGHSCSVFFTPALSHHGKRTRGGSLRLHHDKPIELCVTLPASPA